jgi:hypothetical protein
MPPAKKTTTKKATANKKSRSKIPVLEDKPATNQMPPATEAAQKAASDTAVLVLLNDHRLAPDAVERAAQIAKARGSTLMVGAQGDNVFRAMSLFQRWGGDEAADGAYVSHLYERKRGGSRGGAAPSNPKSRYYGPDGCKENKYDFVFSSSSGADLADRIGRGEDQIVSDSKGYLPLLDALTDHVYSKNPLVVVSFNEEMPHAIQRDYHCVVLDEATAELLVETPPTKPNTPPSGARRSRRFASAVRSSPIKVLTKNRKGFLEYCLADKARRETEGLEIPAALARIMGSATPDFDSKEAAYFKRIITMRKRSGDTGGRSSSSRAAAGAQRTNGIHKKMPVDPKLYDFLVNTCGLEASDEGFSRVDVSRALPKYIKSNGLSQGKNVSLDDTLTNLLGKHDSNDLTFFGLQKLVSPLFV